MLKMHSLYETRIIVEDEIPELDVIVFSLQEALPHEDNNTVIATVLKSKQLLSSNSILSGFKDGEHLVQSSYSSAHTVVTIQSEIKCDSKCSKYQYYGYCAHTVCIVLKEKKN